MSHSCSSFLRRQGNRMMNHSSSHYRRSSLIIQTCILQNLSVYKIFHPFEIESQISNLRFLWRNQFRTRSVIFERARSIWNYFSDLKYIFSKDVNFETFLQEYDIDDSWSIWTFHSTRHVLRSPSSLTDRRVVSDLTVIMHPLTSLLTWYDHFAPKCFVTNERISSLENLMCHLKITNTTHKNITFKRKI